MAPGEGRERYREVRIPHSPRVFQFSRARSPCQPSLSRRFLLALASPAPSLLPASCCSFLVAGSASTCGLFRRNPPDDCPPVRRDWEQRPCRFPSLGRLCLCSEIPPNTVSRARRSGGIPPCPLRRRFRPVDSAEGPRPIRLCSGRRRIPSPPLVPQGTSKTSPPCC